MRISQSHKEWTNMPRIVVTEKTKLAMDKYGYKTETYEDIILRLLKLAEEKDEK